MGRPERPIDPTAGPLQQLAYDLRRLRRTAGGPSYRQLSRRARYSVTALSEAAGGETLPTLAVTLAYVEACGGDREEWATRWQTVAAQLAGKSSFSSEDPADDVLEAQSPPYLGLAAFQPEDVDRFFGRKQLIDNLLCWVVDKPFLAVFGSSGSGKSSLLRAGLIPAVRAGGVTGGHDWFTLLLTPGEHPLQEIAVHLGTLGSIPAGALRADLEADPASMGLAVRQVLLTKSPQARLLIVIDQFEEIFTLCRDERERAQFIDAVLSPMAGSDNRATVVLGIRADFYGRCIDHAGLAAAVQDAQMVLTAMTPDELRTVITQPAAQEGLTVEPALVATILADVMDRPGALPLLSHALLETWRRRQGSRLTLAGYRAAGGVQRAITQTAERVYAGLNAHQQRIARQVFVRLTALGEGTEDTRRRIRRAELDDEDDPDTAVVIDRLATARLITLGENTVEVAHEAVIQAWPRLRQWLTDDRAGLRTHRQLTEAAHDWQALHRDPDALYRGTRLAAVQDWAEQDDHRSELNPLERNFLDASVAQETEERAAAQRRTRRLRQLVAALTVLLMLTVAAGGVALYQRQVAISQHLAAEASTLLAVQPAASALLSAEAYRIKPTVEARSALLNTFPHLANHAVLNGHTGFVNTVAFSPNGRLLASAGRKDSGIILWDTTRHRRLATLVGHTQAIRDVAFSPDGRLLASASRDTTIMLWDVARRTRIATLTGDNARVNAVAFSPDGRTLASATDDHQVILWDVTHRTPIATLAGHSARVRAVAFSPDGRTLASASDDRTIMLWDLASRSRLATLAGHNNWVSDVAFSPDGRTLASASADYQVMVWDVASHTRITTLTGHTAKVNAVAFSPDGHTLASASNDRTIMLWDIASHSRLATLTGHNNYVSDVAFTPDGRTLASSSGDHTVILWNPILPPFAGHTDAVTALALSPDVRTLASGSADQTIILWDVTSGTRLATLTGHTDAVTAVAFSPDGMTLATGTADHTIRLWNVTDPTHPPPLGQPLIGHSAAVNGMAFSPDGHQLVSTSQDKSTIFWDVARRSPIARLPMQSALRGTAAFSPDGRTLAIPTARQTIILWDVAHQARIVTLQAHQGTVPILAFSPDGHTLASGSNDGTITWWDIAHQAPLATLTGHTARITSLIFSPDRHTLISASADHTIIAWNTDLQQIQTRICTVIGHSLTRNEWSQLAPGTSYHQTCN